LPVSDPHLQMDYLDEGGSPATAPTHRLQIRATFGPNVPSASVVTLREFGLVGDLEGSPVLINYRTHQGIAKDPGSTLERTIWLVL
jgi:hypothetical protein